MEAEPLVLGWARLRGRVQPRDAIAVGTAAVVFWVFEVAAPQQRSLSACSPKLAAAGQCVLVSRVLKQGWIVATAGLAPFTPNVAPARRAAAAVVGGGWCNDRAAAKALAEVRARPGGLAGCEGSVLGNRRGGGNGSGEEAGKDVEGEHVCTGGL